MAGAYPYLVQPKLSHDLDALRGVGYSTAAALADSVDNGRGMSDADTGQFPLC